jgi:hypothetical protein
MVRGLFYFAVVLCTACASFVVILRATLDSNTKRWTCRTLGTVGINDNINLGQTDEHRRTSS